MTQVHRNGDSRECGASTVVTGQSTVIANGLLISVAGDANTHGGGELDASATPSTVIIEGKPLMVAGSNASPDAQCPEQGGAHCAPKASSGSPDVVAY